MERKCLLTNLTNDFLLFMFFSIVGWIYETLLFYFWYGGFYHRGFLNIPLLPIYGSVVLTTKYLIGTIENPSNILKKIKNVEIRNTLYILLCFSLPTTVEYFVGLYFDKIHNLRLWDYSNIPLNIDGYICLGYSLFWTLLIFIAINKIVPILSHFFDKFNLRFKIFLTLLFLVIILFDLYLKIQHFY